MTKDKDKVIYRTTFKDGAVYILYSDKKNRNNLLEAFFK